MKKSLLILFILSIFVLLTGCDKTSASTTKTTTKKIETTISETKENVNLYEDYRNAALKSVSKIESDVISLTYDFNQTISFLNEGTTYTVELKDSKVVFEADFRFIDFTQYRNFYIGFDTKFNISSSNKDENEALSILNGENISAYAYFNDTDIEHAYIEYYMNDVLSGIVFGLYDTISNLEDGQTIEDISLSALGVAFMLDMEETKGSLEVADYLKFELTEGLTAQSIISLLFSSKSIGTLFTNILSYLKEFKILDSAYHIDYSSIINMVLPIVSGAYTEITGEAFPIVDTNEIIENIDESKEEIEKLLGKFASNNKYGFNIQNEVIDLGKDTINFSMLLEVCLNEKLEFSGIDFNYSVENESVNIVEEGSLTYQTVLTFTQGE